MPTSAELTAQIEALMAEREAVIFQETVNEQVKAIEAEMARQAEAKRENFLNNGIARQIGPVLREITNRFKDLYDFLYYSIPVCYGTEDAGNYGYVSAGLDGVYGPRSFGYNTSWEERVVIREMYWAAIDNAINSYARNGDDPYGDHPVKGSDRGKISHFLYGDHTDSHSGQNVIGTNRHRKNFLPPFNYEK